MEMVHQLKAVTLVSFLATNVLLLGVLGIDEGLGAAPAGFTHTDSGGGVTINVTYLHPQGANEIRFEVVMDSHTVNLDAYDLTALTFLRDETGEIYQPNRVNTKGAIIIAKLRSCFPKFVLQPRGWSL